MGFVEAGVLVDIDGEPFYWHTPPNRNSGALPDSHDLWLQIWDNRKKLSGFAHTHPGDGFPRPSTEDLTTFDAIERGLNRRLNWWIANTRGLVTLVKWNPAGHYQGESGGAKPKWLDRLIELSLFQGA